LTRRLPYPVAPFILVQTEAAPATASVTPASSNAPAATPARLRLPVLDEGPHLGYAFQWFAFAFIALVGAAFGIRADRLGPGRRGSQRAQRTAG
jgi:cytochrome oxidase assembly protein ShyY1